MLSLCAVPWRRRPWNLPLWASPCEPCEPGLRTCPLPRLLSLKVTAVPAGPLSAAASPQWDFESSALPASARRGLAPCSLPEASPRRHWSCVSWSRTAREPGLHSTQKLPADSPLQPHEFSCLVKNSTQFSVGCRVSCLTWCRHPNRRGPPPSSQSGIQPLSHTTLGTYRLGTSRSGPAARLPPGGLPASSPPRTRSPQADHILRPPQPSPSPLVLISGVGPGSPARHLGEVGPSLSLFLEPSQFRPLTEIHPTPMTVLWARTLTFPKTSMTASLPLLQRQITVELIILNCKATYHSLP